MAVANSVFDTVHNRPVRFYNRAALELVVAVLFDIKYSIPTASIIDSSVLMSVFGDFLRARNKYRAYHLNPIELRVDTNRHFSVDKRDSLVYKAAASYLSGKAQTGRELIEDPGPFPLVQNFAFISKGAVESRGRRDLVSQLNSGELKSLDGFSPFFIENAQEINFYFTTAADEVVRPIGPLFSHSSLGELMVPRIQRYVLTLNEMGLGSFEVAINESIGDLAGKQKFTRNELNYVGRINLGPNDWDRYFKPFVNTLYWEILSELMLAEGTANLEMGANIDAKIASAIITSSPQPPSHFTKQHSFAQNIETEADDGFASTQRAPIDWDAIVKLSTSPEARKYLQKIRSAPDQSSAEKASASYLDFISRNLNPIFSIEQDELGSFTIQMGSGRKHMPDAVLMVQKFSPYIATVLGATFPYMLGIESNETAFAAASAAVVVKLLDDGAPKLNGFFDEQYRKHDWHHLVDLEVISQHARSVRR